MSPPPVRRERARAGGVPGGPCDKHHAEAHALRRTLSSSQSPKAVTPGGKGFFAGPVTPE